MGRLVAWWEQQTDNGFVITTERGGWEVVAVCDENAGKIVEMTCAMLSGKENLEGNESCGHKGK